MLRKSSSAQLDFDWQQLRQLAGGDADFELELIAIFLEDTEENLDRLEQAITAQSIPVIADLAHTLRGSSANVGARSLTQAAHKLEHIVCSGQLSEPFADPFAEVSQLLSQMRQHCRGIQTQFRT